MNQIGHSGGEGGQREMVDYLLGRLSEDQQAALEKRYFCDDKLFTQLLLAKEALIESYVRGGLNQMERERFERYFLTTPQRYEQVALARSLVQRLGESPPSRTPIQAMISETSWGSRWRAVFAFWNWRNWAITGLALVLISSIWLVIGYLQKRQPDDQMQVRRAPQERPVMIPTPGEQKLPVEPISTPSIERAQRSVPSSPPKSDVVIALLSPGLLRDEIPVKVVIPTKAHRLRARLMLESQANYEDYLVVLRRSNGEELWRQSGWRMRSSDAGIAVEGDVPTTLLTTGEYLLALSGLKADGQLANLANYHIRIEKK